MIGYVNQVVGDDLSKVEFTFFLGSYRYPDVDVVHFHDVDGILGGRERKPKERVAAATDILEHVHSNGIALVRTVVDSPGREDPALDILDRATNTFIVLDDATPTPDSQRTTLIPHAHYRERFLGYPRGEQVAGRLLCIARTGVGRAAEGPLKVFSVTDTPGLSLRIVGAADPALDSLVPRASARDRGESVSLRTERLSDAEIVREVGAAELVVLPEIVSLADMGLLFTVLSLDRPVLLPDSGAARALEEQVGAGWVLRHAGPVTAEILDEKMTELRGIDRAPRPHLEGRGLDSTAAAYAEVYRTATGHPMSLSL